MYGTGAIFLLLMLLVTDKLTCDEISAANTGSGGLLQGDPAPGRSPGPPSEKIQQSVHHRAADENPTILLTSTEQEDNCSLEGNVQASPVDRNNVSVEVSHHLFNTE
ncbi:hypothetical protein QE152_g32578 [Popillia japonica]|uniref:Uncharacterized protein n=1 Tax=Popillia japonica TaxID=7064 RepID=A0AAW1IZ35_POPJA